MQLESVEFLHDALGILILTLTIPDAIEHAIIHLLSVREVAHLEKVGLRFFTGDFGRWVDAVEDLDPARLVAIDACDREAEVEAPDHHHADGSPHWQELDHVLGLDGRELLAERLVEIYS